MKTTILALLFFSIPFASSASSGNCEQVHNKASSAPNNYDLRTLNFEFFEVQDRKPVEGGFQYSIGIKAANQQTPAPQKGKIEQFLSDLPQFALRYGFEVGKDRIWFLDENAINFRILKLRKAKDPAASLFTVKYDNSGRVLSVKEYVAYLLKGQFPLSLIGKDPLAGDLFTHDTNTHLVAFLTMPISVKNWMHQRLKDRLELLEFAEKTGSQTLIDFANNQLVREVKHIDSFTANMSLSRTNRIDEFLGHDVFQATANYIFGGMGGLVPESFQSVLRNLGIDIQNNLNSLVTGLSRNDLAELRRIASKTYADITREQSAEMAKQWIERSRYTGE